MTGQRGEYLACLQVPQLNRVISAARGDKLSVRRNSQRFHWFVMTLQSSCWVISAEIVHVIPLKATQIVRERLWSVIV